MTPRPEVLNIVTSFGRWEIIYHYVFGRLTTFLLDRSTGDTFTRDDNGYHLSTQNELDLAEKLEESTSI